MFGVILKATNSSFQKGMPFCRSIYVKKVMKLLAFIFEQPSYSDSFFFSISLALSIFLPFLFSASAGRVLAFFLLVIRPGNVFIVKAGLDYFCQKIFPPPP